jgi:hypothetical protein
MALSKGNAKEEVQKVQNAHVMKHADTMRHSLAYFK